MSRATRIRSYVLSEDDGRVGTLCVYQATSPEAIREHASRAGLAADEIIPVADAVIVRPDPAAISAGRIRFCDGSPIAGHPRA